MDFWHLGAYKELNTCFIHFVNVGRLFGLLGDKELEPMMPLVEIWLEKGWLPRPSSSAGSVASSAQGQQQQQGGSQQQQHKKEGSQGSERTDRRDMQPPARPASAGGAA